MRNFSRVICSVFVLLLMLIILAFVLENQQSVSLTFLGWSGPELPVSVITISAILAGMLIGPILGWLLGRSSRAARKRLS